MYFSLTQIVPLLRLSQTFIFSSDHNTRWRLMNFIIIRLWLYVKKNPFTILKWQICHSTSCTSQQDGDSIRDALSGWTKLCLFDCLLICFGLFNFSIFFFIILLMHKHIRYRLMPSCILIFANKPNSRLGGK
jgi:hypothetical protein